MGKKSFNKLRVEKKRVERDQKKRGKKMQSKMCGLLINYEV
jgi:hypothetical protein